MRNGLSPIVRTRYVLGVLLLAGAALIVPRARGDEGSPDFSAEQIEFFERQIRPLLVDNCYRCHADQEQKGGLRVDSRAAWLAGGDTGPAIEPRKPEESLAVEALRYGPDGYQMPPTGKLSDKQIKLFERWVADGAPWPAESTAAAVKPASGFELAERAKHWAYQPLAKSSPPPVRDVAWAKTELDAYILAPLEAASLAPAAPLPRAAWLRRVTFDLIGLPPTTEELAAYLADNSPQAEARVVERLLASPHYGERWGRHWLDLVRYADTLGHEFDYDIYHAWRYRDYVVRALNADLPYDQFVVEHLAGDLLTEPRRNPHDGTNESVLGTGFYWLLEASHSPVDVRQTQADRIDNQLDVLGKTFLAQTIACARCHDHKFDAIATKDYYALAGYLKSSRYQQAPLDPGGRIAAGKEQLAQIRAGWVGELPQQRPGWHRVGEQVAASLLAAREVNTAVEQSTNGAQDRDAHCGRIARERGLDPSQLTRWLEALAGDELKDPAHPLHAWRVLGTASADPAEFGAESEALALRLSAASDDAAARLAGATRLAGFADPQLAAWRDWLATGDSFGAGPASSGEWLLTVAGANREPRARLVPPGAAHSGQLSPRLEGTLRSPSFTIDRRYLHVLAAGRGSRLNVIIDGFTLIRDPIYGGLTIGLDDDRLAWRTFDLELWRGHRAYLELVDSPLPNPTQTLPEAIAQNRAVDGYLFAREIRTSDEVAPALSPSGISSLVLTPPVASVEELAARYQSAVLEAVAAATASRESGGTVDDDHVALVNWMLASGLLHVELKEDVAAYYREVEAALPAPQYALAMVDGTGEDERVFVRGNYRVLGEPAPRRFMQVFGGVQERSSAVGSGRLELARRVVDPAQNPLLARVMVNRLWQHHFGRGLVATPDDFGHMGELPTHPELLDYLARRFIESGWSLKAMHRLMLNSATYRLSGQASPEAVAADPTNRLWQHVPPQRLEVEAIRDALLTVSGRLDRTVGGPPIMPYIEEGTVDRGTPQARGPLDGDGRRTLYTGVRRNFIQPMLVAFDFPRPITTMGRRGTSNTPSQSLAMLNNPFVLDQARVWAERVLAEHPQVDAHARITAMYLAAFSRAPDAQELDAALAYLDARMRAGDTPPLAYQGLAHALMNTKEFVFVE
ncbi:MAG: PSD1 domain-containing protein [Pirellulales bacterium]|nr:PSD1 domain-containing protein [Pirellulales bacterium]